MIYEHTSYRTYLKSVLAERISKNPAYSLRAMAKALDVQPSHLSAVQRGGKNLSLAAALKIAQRLGLDARETEYFCLLVQYDNERSPELRDAFLQRLREMNHGQNGAHAVRDLSVDAFKMIADWYHIPILEMTTLTDFDFTPAKIAKRLGITPLEAEVAIERLERLELLEKVGGRYRKTHHDGIFKSEIPNLALRRFHKQMLEKASEALETQTLKEKFVGSETFSLDPQHIEAAKRMIDQFMRELVHHFNRGKKTETYHLGVQLFKLTKEKNQ